MNWKEKPKEERTELATNWWWKWLPWLPVDDHELRPPFLDNQPDVGISLKQELSAHSKGCNWRHCKSPSIEGNGGNTGHPAKLLNFRGSSAVAKWRAVNAAIMDIYSFKAQCVFSQLQLERHFTRQLIQLGIQHVENLWRFHSDAASCCNDRQQQEELSTGSLLRYFVSVGCSFWNSIARSSVPVTRNRLLLVKP